MSLTDLNAWKKLEKNYTEMRGVQMRDMFAADPKRFDEFSVSLNDLLLDYSKNRVDADTMKNLIDLAKEAGVEQMRDKMFSGEKSTSPKTAPSCTPLCATARTVPSTLTARMSCLKSKPFWKK